MSFSEREHFLVDLFIGGDRSLTMFPFELKTCLRALRILAGEREERDGSAT